MLAKELEALLTKAYETGSFDIIYEKYWCIDEYSVSMRATIYAKKIVAEYFPEEQPKKTNSQDEGQYYGTNSATPYD